MPAQSVAVAGFQTGIYPAAGPGGWQIIGKTPIRPFDARMVDPFLFKPGDQVTFEAIALTAYEQIDAQWDAGTFDLSTIHV